MELHERQSGLLVPAEKPAPPQQPRRYYGPLECQDEEQRKEIEKAMTALWNALGLRYGGGGIDLPGRPTRLQREAWSQVYNYAGRIFLGDDIPEHEVLT